MAASEPTRRNLWIIAGLVLVAMAALAWFLNLGGPTGGDMARVSVEPPPERKTVAGDNDPRHASALGDIPAPPAAGSAAGN